MNELELFTKVASEQWLHKQAGVPVSALIKAKRMDNMHNAYTASSAARSSQKALTAAGGTDKLGRGHPLVKRYARSIGHARINADNAGIAAGNRSI